MVELFPHGLKGLVLIGVLSAIMSTADISVLTGSASLTKDIYQRYFHPEASEKTLMRVGLAASLLVGVLGAVFGWFTQDIMNILLITFTINSAGLFLPTIGAFFWKKSCSATLMTSAPNAHSTRDAVGAATTVASSTTRIPSRGIFFFCSIVT